MANPRRIRLCRRFGSEKKIFCGKVSFLGETGPILFSRRRKEAAKIGRENFSFLATVRRRRRHDIYPLMRNTNKNASDRGKERGSHTSSQQHQPFLSPTQGVVHTQDFPSLIVCVYVGLIRREEGRIRWLCNFRT